MSGLEGLDHIAIAVVDVDRSAGWYAEVLGLERRHADVWDGPPIMMCAGDSCVALFPTEGSNEVAPGRGAIAMRHFGFRTSRADWLTLRSALEERGLEPEFADHTICHSVYISDPDGHRVEIATYELD